MATKKQVKELTKQVKEMINRFNYEDIIYSMIERRFISEKEVNNYKTNGLPCDIVCAIAHYLNRQYEPVSKENVKRTKLLKEII